MNSNRILHGFYDLTSVYIMPSTIILMIVVGMSLFILPSCNESNQAVNTNAAGNEVQEVFQSKTVRGQSTTDNNTAIELRAMQSSMINFNLLIKKQPQNLSAYRAYAEILKNHIDRTVTYCGLDQNTKSTLCKELDKIKDKVAVIESGNIDQARDANKDINKSFGNIDSLFNFDYK